MEIKKFELGREYYKKEYFGCGFDEYALTIITKVLKRTAKTITVEIKTYGEYTYSGETAKDLAIELARKDNNPYITRKYISANYKDTHEIIFTCLTDRQSCEHLLSCEEEIN